MRLLVLLDGVVIAALLGERLAARDDGTHAKLRTGFQDVVVRVENDAARFGPSENFGAKAGVGAADFDGPDFGIALGLDLKFHRHAEEIEILLDLAINAETGLGAKDGIGNVKFGYSGGIDPLGKERLNVGRSGLIGVGHRGGRGRCIPKRKVGRLGRRLDGVILS